jgi:hypothetical protein
MKRREIQDERILAQKRKIGSDAFQIVFYGLLLSVLIQQFLFQAPFSQYIVEFILFITASLYIVIRNLTVGHDIFSAHKMGQKLVIINSIVSGLVIAVINSFLNYIRLGELFTTDLMNSLLVTFVTFIIASIVAFLMFEALYIVNRKRQLQIETKFTEQDEEE